MSDPKGMAEIEDVLSSIRRLVAADGRGAASAKKPAPPPPPAEPPVDRLVLTPALRVEDPEPAELPVAELPPAAPPAAGTPPRGPDPAPPAAAVPPAPAPPPEPPVPDALKAWDEDKRAEKGASETLADDLEETLAALEAELDHDLARALPDEAGRDPGEDDADTVAGLTDPLSFLRPGPVDHFADETAGHADLAAAIAGPAPVAAAPAGAAQAPAEAARDEADAAREAADAAPAPRAPRQGFIWEAAFADDPADGAADPAPGFATLPDETPAEALSNLLPGSEPEAVEALAAPDIWPDPEPLDTAGAAEPPASLPDEADEAPAAIAELADIPAPAEAPPPEETVVAEAWTVAEPPSADVPDAEPPVADFGLGSGDRVGDDPDLDDSDLFDTEDPLPLDEAALRDLVSEIIRDELRGALGDRIARNLRKLVRREIELAMAARGLDPDS